MNRLHKWFGMALLASVTALPAQANLVNNSGFETGDFSGWSTQAAAAGSNFAVINGLARSGTFGAMFWANQAQYDSIWQTLNTTQGETYTINFWVYNGGIENDSLQVVWEGNTILESTPIGAELESWTEFSINALATTNGSQLKFMLYDGNSVAGLDDINVTAAPVPEPASMAILGSGLLLLIRRRRAQ
ncbi:MAG: PEP-CTERM sorting domain-containing protein [Fimbriimonadaceae bacterium]|nr:PEP-CTERM sorting domain-containing protein [Fimbriimonadaceae bacterium]